MSLHLLTSPPSQSRSPGKVLITITILLASLFPLTLVPSAKEDRPGKDGQFSGKQGEVLWIATPVPEQATHVVGNFLDRKITFFPQGKETYVGLLGIDMQEKPGLKEFPVTITLPNRTDHLSYTVLVMKEQYKVQHLTLPKNKVDLDKKTLTRVIAEKKEVKEAFQRSSPHPLWEGPFIEPVKGRISGRFGNRRIINGQPRSPHSGEDIAAPKGTKVAAMNTGIVQLTPDHFFSGKGVILDHGIGLHSMYFHLSEISVKNGQLVKKGQTIGKVGATGRATGPHLHWGVRLNGARINPYSFTSLPINN